MLGVSADAEVPIPTWEHEEVSALPQPRGQAIHELLKQAHRTESGTRASDARSHGAAATISDGGLDAHITPELRLLPRPRDGDRTRGV